MADRIKIHFSARDVAPVDCGSIRILNAEATADRNAIVMAGAVAGLQRPILLLPPEHKANAISLNLDRLNFRSPRIVRSRK